MKLTPRADRPARLLARGVPATCLQTLEGLKQRTDDLQFWIQDHDAAYFYLELASPEEVQADWPELLGKTVTPVYGNSNGDVFVLLCEAGDEYHYVWFGLEESVMCDYGSSFQRAIADFVITYYENAEDPLEVVSAVATELGLSCGPELLEALARAPRATFEEDREWRRTVLTEIVQG